MNRLSLTVPIKALMHIVTASVLWPTAIVTGVMAVKSIDDEWSPYSQDTLSTVHLVFLNLSIAHFSALFSIMIAKALTNHSASFLYRCYVSRLCLCVLHLVMSITYWFAMFQPRLCTQLSSNMCSTLANVYSSHLVYVISAMVLQCFALMLSAYTYITHRHHNWQYMYELEDVLSFHSTLIDGETCRDVQRFCNYWYNKTSREITDEIPSRAKNILRAMVVDMDTSDDGSINRTEFDTFARKNGVTDTIDTAWKLLSDPKTGTISENGIRHALYNLSFCRKRLAMLLYTDKIVVSWAMRVLDLIVYGGCTVVAIDLWGYPDAFGNGIDLLKTYLFIVTYALNASVMSIRFLITMIIHRPYNIGDVIRLDADQIAGAGSTGGIGSDIYQVCKITLGYTSVEGSSLLQIPNSLLVLSKPVRNLSKTKMNDSVRIRFPITTDDSIIEEVTSAIAQYAADKPYEVDTSIQAKCVWIVATDSHKDLQCHWTYAIDVCDTGTAKYLMFNVRNAVIHRIWRRLREDTLVLMSSQGGAFNTLAVDKLIPKYGIGDEEGIRHRQPRRASLQDI